MKINYAIGQKLQIFYSAVRANWLKVDDIYASEVSKMMYQYAHSCLPLPIRVIYYHGRARLRSPISPAEKNMAAITRYYTFDKLMNQICSYVYLGNDCGRILLLQILEI